MADPQAEVKTDPQANAETKTSTLPNMESIITQWFDNLYNYTNGIMLYNARVFDASVVNEVNGVSEVNRSDVSKKIELNTHSTFDKHVLNNIFQYSNQSNIIIGNILIHKIKNPLFEIKDFMNKPIYKRKFHCIIIINYLGNQVSTYIIRKCALKLSYHIRVRGDSTNIHEQFTQRSKDKILVERICISSCSLGYLIFNNTKIYKYTKGVIDENRNIRSNAAFDCDNYANGLNLCSTLKLNSVLDPNTNLIMYVNKVDFDNRNTAPIPKCTIYITRKDLYCHKLNYVDGICFSMQPAND